MDRGRGKPVEELRVLTVDAVLQICIFGWLQKLLSVHEVQWRVGGRRKQWSRRWMEETEELHHTAGQSLHSLLKSLEIASSDPQQG